MSFAALGVVARGWGDTAEGAWREGGAAGAASFAILRMRMKERERERERATESGTKHSGILSSYFPEPT